MLIFRFTVIVLLIALFLYYLFCFLEVFGIVKFTTKDTEIKFPKAFIPFYYIFKK